MNKLTTLVIFSLFGFMIGFVIGFTGVIFTSYLTGSTSIFPFLTLMNLMESGSPSSSIIGVGI
ncbi:Hypothetical protein Nlim_1728 [Candidatus Nitrosarchaeum limnium SFB1]|jgi:hypothetical protein|uniref:Uncharacterized protein n=1 Tax=Candidatus Nitrosarchaeum limnium SFB1 TaxID=886738 RepID=F3KMH8_9ARCH|nr:Hypothetical protein Nlim_1728 [Candidatus Nitrosarchaeum limnium SFB1]